MKSSIPIEVVARDPEAHSAVRALLERASAQPLSFVDPHPVLRVHVLEDGVAADGPDPSPDVRIDPRAPGVERQAERIVACAALRAGILTAVPDCRHHLGAIFDTYRRATAIVARDGRVLDLNLAARTLLRRPSHELLGAHVDELLAAGEGSLGPRRLRTARAASGRTRSATRRFRAGLDDTIELLAVVHPVRDTTGRRAYFVVELRDPLEDAFPTRDRGEAEAIARALRRIDGLAARGSHPQRVYMEMLRRYCELLDGQEALVARRQDPEQVLRVQAVLEPDGRSEFEERLPPDGVLPEVEHSLVGHAVRSGEPVVARDPLPLCGIDPHERPLENALAFPLRRFGEVVGVIIVAGSSRTLDRSDAEALRPLTATCAGVMAAHLERERRTRTDERLAENRRTIETLLANLPGVIFRTQDDDQRTLEFASAGVESLLGASVDYLLGREPRGLTEFTADADRRSVLDELRWAVLQKRRFDATYRMRRGEETIWVHEQSQGVFGSDGDLLFIEGFLTDVTGERRAQERRRQLEDRVRRAQKIDSLATLAEGVARDYNNLLLGVIGSTQLLEGRLASGDEEARAALERIEEAAGRAADLTRYMLAYTGQEQVLLEPHSAASVVRRALPMIERELPPGIDLELDLDLDGGDARIAADSGPLQRALVEAVRNAAEAQPEGGRVRIAIELRELQSSELTELWLGSRLASGEYVVLVVEDDGQGMDDNVRNRAFDPFFSTRGEGRGLGLAVVLGTLRTHGGAVRLTSAPGRGTRLELVLPPLLGPAPVRGELTPQPPRVRPSGSRPRVLVVDDEPMVRDVARSLLERSGFRVECANGGADAVDRVAGDPAAFDAVLLDLSMPGQDGLQTLEGLRRLRPDLPVLMSSGYAEQRTIDRLQSMPAVAFLRKPYRLAELLEKLDLAVAGGHMRP